MGDDPAKDLTTSRHNPSEQWSTYEANVQAYRSLSVSSQSLFLTVGAILLGWDLRIPFFTVLAMAMITTWYIWFPAIFSRTAIVDFHKFRLGDRFDKNGDVQAKGDKGSRLDERDYARVTNLALRRRVYEHLSRPGYKHRTIRVTRRKLDVYLPILFTIVWVIFAVYVLLYR